MYWWEWAITGAGSVLFLVILIRIAVYMAFIIIMKGLGG